jgi:hypothetical protein
MRHGGAVSQVGLAGNHIATAGQLGHHADTGMRDRIGGEDSEVVGVGARDDLVGPRYCLARWELEINRLPDGDCMTADGYKDDIRGDETRGERVGNGGVYYTTRGLFYYLRFGEQLEIPS